MVCSEDLDDVSERFVFVKEGKNVFLYPKPAAAEMRGVQVKTDGTLSALGNPLDQLDMAGMREEMDNMEPPGTYFLEARKKGAFFFFCIRLQGGKRRVAVVTSCE